MFTWIPIHRETIQKILDQPISQAELLAVLNEMEAEGLKVIKLQDRDVDGKEFPLAEIDPFTFLATFNRGVTVENRQENWKFLKQHWALRSEIPADFTGIPIMFNMNSWFFPFAAARTEDHVKNLWTIAMKASSTRLDQLDEKLFNECRNLERMNLNRLSIGLFWINPRQFLPADKKTTAYGIEKSVTIVPKDFQTYQQWMKQMTEKLGKNYPEISHAAHLFALQGNNSRFAQWMPHLLDALRTLGGTAKPKSVEDKIKETLRLPDSVLTKINKSGQTRFYNELHWARKYLVWEGLIDSSKRGTWALTKKGWETTLNEMEAQRIAKRWAEHHRKLEVEDPSQGVAELTESYQVAENKETAQESQSRRYWNFSAGKNGKYWEEFLEKGIMGIGYDGTPDLREFKSREEIRIRLLQLQPGTSKRKHDSLACWQFVHEIRKGDIVFAKKGFSKLLGYGLVEGDYEFDAQRAHCKHVRKVKWLGQGEWQVPKESRMAPKTLTDITSYPDFVKLIANKVGLELEPMRPQQGADIASTGVAYWWLNANPKMWNFEDTPVGQTQTYTSHNEQGNKRQKYKYFQEVKPGDLVVGYVTSPQKEVIAICRITKGLHKAGNDEKIEFEKIEQLDRPIPYDTLKANPDLQESEPVINNQGSLFKLTQEEYEIIRNVIDETNIPVRTEIKTYTKQTAMKELFLPESQFDEMLDALEEKKNVVLQGPPGVGKTFVARRLAYALIGSNDPQRIQMIQFHQSYSYEDFIQGFRPTDKGHFDLKYGVFHQFCRRVQREESARKPYVFIIDEINRGNLSKIFGELMMLIEPDKRGKDHAIPLTYSQDADEKFYIPENLHLIGMMNTADRSLAMVDYALRRRFRFITLRPEFASQTFRQFLEDAGVGAELLNKIVARMTALNEVIAMDTKNLGSGYQVGHSYFCPGKGINPDENWYRRVIESEIVPLIQEYWFDNEQKVKEQRSALLSEFNS